MQQSDAVLIHLSGSWVSTHDLVASFKCIWPHRTLKRINGSELLGAYLSISTHDLFTI